MYFRPPFYLREKFSLPKLKDNDDIPYKKDSLDRVCYPSCLFYRGKFILSVNIPDFDIRQHCRLVIIQLSGIWVMLL
ncbi:hypothetical protein IMSAGC004_02796 [Bacteroidaceae bacterium]|nr:hypothetical protein IMSAGC004_02796 [Bacteroidaceae bacterium]